MKKLILLSNLLVIAAGAAAMSFPGTVLAQDPVISSWDFQNFGQPPPAVPPYIIHPASDGGTVSGTATPLGMNNSYVYPYTPPTTGANDGEDVLATAGSSTAGTFGAQDDSWRIRGQTNAAGPAGSANGWNTAAPQYTQGLEIDVPTTGFNDIVFKFDWFCTNQGVSDMQTQYTVDGVNWLNVNSSISVASGPNIGLSVATPNAFNNGVTIDFGALGIHTVDNDLTFGVRLVSAYDQTFNNTVPNPGTGDTGFGTTYTGASSGVYNNTSGNWRFDNISVSGVVAVPEPSTFVLASIGLVGVGICGWRKRRVAAASSRSK